MRFTSGSSGWDHELRARTRWVQRTGPGAWIRVFPSWGDDCSSSLACRPRHCLHRALRSPLGASSSGLFAFLVQGCGMTEERKFSVVSTGCVALISSGSFSGSTAPAWGGAWGWWTSPSLHCRGALPVGLEFLRYFHFKSIALCCNGSLRLNRARCLWVLVLEWTEFTDSLSHRRSPLWPVGQWVEVAGQGSEESHVHLNMLRKGQLLYRTQQSCSFSTLLLLWGAVHVWSTLRYVSPSSIYPVKDYL
jgi:hypothetical protein